MMTTMLDNAYIVDIETNGLKATLIHCLSYIHLSSGRRGSLTDYEEIKKFLEQENLTIIGHNFIKYDRPTLERILACKFKFRVIDTLGLSWVLHPKRKKHGLEEWGEELGVEKPKIADWSNLSQAEYIHRCEQDTEINLLLWQQQYDYFRRLYDSNLQMLFNYFKYIELKLTCVAEQEEIGVRLDVEHCQNMLQQLYTERDEKVAALTAAMPPVYKKDFKSPPKVMYKKDGTLSVHGQNWVNFLIAHDLPETHTEPVEYVKYMEEANPNSTEQKKDWLYSLGWVPEHIQYKRNKETGEIKEIPQIKHKDIDREGEVCDSIKKLFEKEPALEIMEGLSIITHRIGLFEGFLRDAQDGRLYPGMKGFTNTMRLKHAIVVNLPKTSKKYGKEVRGALIADEGKILCGSDLSNIEATTRNHYVFPYDPKYVADMTAPGFDSHTDIAVLAGFIKRVDEEFFKWVKSFDKEKQIYKYIPKDFGDEKGHFGYTLQELQVLVGETQKNIISKISEERQKGKTVNFAAIYGSGALTLSRNSGLDFDLCVKLLEVYWERNWSVKRVAEDCYTKELDGQMWLFNPISKFFYTLRAEKDRFSTLNQGSAVYVFDVWMSFMRKLGIRSCLQMHDETLFNLFPEQEQEMRDKVQKAMDLTNDMLKLNVKIGCSADFGKRYSECH